MGDTYETLAELCDRAELLSCQVHGMIAMYQSDATRPDILFDKEIEKARRQICSSYTTVLDAATLASKKPLNVFKDRAPKISNALSKDYTMFLEMMKFREDTKRVLAETIRNSVNFKFGLNSDLTAKLLDLITGYTKLHLLLDPKFQKADDKSIGPQDVVILYQTALKCQKGHGHDNETNQLKGYLELFCEGNALRTVKEDMQAISDMVGVYLLRFYDTLQKLLNTESSTQQIVGSAAFSVIDKIDKLGLAIDSLDGYRAGGDLDPDDGGGGAKLLKNYYGSARFYLDLSYVSKMKDWVFYGLLACPSVLGGPQGETAVKMLQIVASDGWLVRVYREHIMDMHDVWEDHFKFLKTQKTTAKYVGKAKDHLHEIEKQCMQTAGKHHGIRRSFLRNIIPQFIKVFKQCPGLLGPQFPVVVALLSFAREELEFYYMHRNKVPRKGGQVYKGWGAYPKHEPEDWYDGKVVVLISLVEQLRHFSQRHAKVVANYNALFLRDVRVEEAQGNRECLNALKKCHDDFEVCLEALHDASPEGDFLAFRNAWHRCASKINDGWNPPRKYQAQLHKLQVIMDVAVRQSRYIDMQAHVHQRLTSLRRLWWHNMDIIQDYEQTTLHNDHTVLVDPLFAVDGVRFFNTAVENSHPLVPEDKVQIGEASVQCARHLLKKICFRVGRAIFVNYDKKRELDASATLPVNEQTQHLRSALLFNTTQALHYMCRLAHSFASHPTVVIYHTEIIPKMYLREQLSQFLKTFILGPPKQSHMSLVKQYELEPDKIFQSLNLYLTILGQACDQAGLQHTSLVREVLREQVGSVGASIDARSSVMLAEGETLVSQLSDMFVHYIEKACHSSVTEDNGRMATYCPIYEGFIFLGIRGKRGQKQTWLQSRFSTNELANLMGLLGPTGVRFVQANLLERVFKKNVQRLMQIVHRNKDKIPALEIAIQSSKPNALDIAQSMEQLDEFMHCLGTVSVLIAFRSMLYSALARAGGKTPIIQQFCSLATRGVEFEVSSESMDLVSQACGMKPVVDYLMQDALQATRDNVLKSIQNNRSKVMETLGKSIAVLAAAAYTCPEFWHYKVNFETSLGVMNNNAHLFGPTLMKLVYDLTTLEQSEAGCGPGSSIPAGGSKVKAIAAGVMREHFQTGSYLIMRQKLEQEQRTEGRMPLQVMLYALQMSVQSANTLVAQTFFESIVPYKYVHFAWTEIVRGRRGHDSSYYKTKDPEELMHFVDNREEAEKE